MVSALIGVCSGLLIVLIGLLIAMTTRQGSKIDKIVTALTLKVDGTDYKEMVQTINLKLDKHNNKLLRIMIFTKMIDATMPDKKGEDYEDA